MKAIMVNADGTVTSIDQSEAVGRYVIRAEKCKECGHELRRRMYEVELASRGSCDDSESTLVLVEKPLEKPL